MNICSNLACPLKYLITDQIISFPVISRVRGFGTFLVAEN